MPSPDPNTLSLLWPESRPVTTGGTPVNRSDTDLALGAIVPALDFDGRHRSFIWRILSELNSNPQVINYRQQMLEDLLRLPKLVEGFSKLLPQLGELATAGRGSGWGENLPLIQVGSRLAELEHYVSCVDDLAMLLDNAGGKLQAAGLLKLQAFLKEIKADSDYQKLAAALPGLRSEIDKAGSVTIGINLDAQLRPESATLLSINEGHFAGKGGFLERLLGSSSSNLRGVTPLYRALEGKTSMPEHQLFREMNEMLERIILPVAEALGQYTRHTGAPLAALEPELAFYLGAVRLTNELRAAGLALCRPEIAPAEAGLGEIKGLYCFDLALRFRANHSDKNFGGGIVTNDVAFGPEATIFILTGPNSGGKTTFTRAVGQAQILFQAGLMVPASAARLSPVDGIYTHFILPERPETEGGRLADELERMAEIFKAASRYSLILLNEPLASTDHVSARLLSREILAGLRLLGARTIYVTHLHELVEDGLAMVKQSAGASVVSLVAGVSLHSGNGKDPTPDYTIKPGLPQTLGHAVRLAREYGLSFPQIEQSLRERGIQG
jgi:hypothetical protein